MRTLTILILIMVCGCADKQAIDTEKLVTELDSIMEVDQKYRYQMQDAQQKYGWDSPEMKELWEKQNAIDESNLKRILEIIDQVDGYPGKSLVGRSAGKTAFYVLQHAPDSIQEQYYDLIVNAAEQNDWIKAWLQCIGTDT